MEPQIKIQSPEVLLEEYRLLLQSDDTVEALPLQVSGNSMSPFLTHGRDTVYLSRLSRPVRRGDILLYRRDSGTYVLHRVFAVTAQGYTMLGDAQIIPETGIRPEQVIAVVSRVVRRGKSLEPGAFCWKFYEKNWPRLRGVRRLAGKIIRTLRRK